jgi:cation diffusion facilitator family transporter
MNEVYHHSIKFKAALSSVIAAVFLTALKLIFALITGSLGLLSEFAHSGLDLFAALITVFTIKVSNKPADEDHNYGHGKIENLSAIAQVFFLLATCIYIIYEAVNRLFFEVTYHLEITPWAFLVMIISIVVDFSRSRLLYRVAHETRSQALEADAMHFSTDIWSSAVVILGLLLVSLNISREADAIAALLVAFIVIYVSLKLAKRAVDQLMDKVPEGIYEDIMKSVSKIKGVEKIKSLRLRESGPKIFIDMTICISRTIQFQQAHDIMDEVEDTIKEIKPNSDVTIHSEPLETENETLVDKARLIVTSSGLKCHDIFTYKVDDKNILELHIEYNKNDNFVDAHALISDIETKLYQELKGVHKVRIHIDEPSGITLQSKNVTLENEDLIIQIQKVVKYYKDVIECNDINIIETDGKLRVSITCVFPVTFEFSTVHRLVHSIESDIYLISNNISYVLIHAEPQTIETN